MKIVQLVAVAYLGLGIFRDFFTNKPDAAVLDRLEAILARLKGAQ